MPANLDSVDRRILYELDINSRQPGSTLAKKVGLSKAGVGLRIKKLLNERVISSLYTVIDISKLGFTIHKTFLKLQNLDQVKEAELIAFLVHQSDVVWVASCEGMFDLAFGTWARNVEHLDRTLKELNRQFGAYISERQIATIIRGEYFIRDYLAQRKEPSEFRKSFFGSVASATDMDRANWTILSELAKNSRSTSVMISRKARISPDAVALRIKHLENAGIIRHYNIVPNEAQYPYLHYKVVISFRSISEERERALIEYCRISPNIVYIVKSLGPWDFEFDVEVESAGQFRTILMDLKSEFQDVIRDYSVLQIYQVYKYNFCPSIPEI